MTAPASAGSNLGDQSDAAAQSYFNRPTNHLVGTPTTGMAKVTPQQEAELPARALITMHMSRNNSPAPSPAPVSPAPHQPLAPQPHSQQYNSIAANQRLPSPFAPSNSHPIEPIPVNPQLYQSTPGPDDAVPISEVVGSASSSVAGDPIHLLAHVADLSANGATPTTFPPGSPSQPALLPLPLPAPAQLNGVSTPTQALPFDQSSTASPGLHFGSLPQGSAPVASTSALGSARAPVQANGATSTRANLPNSTPSSSASLHNGPVKPPATPLPLLAPRPASAGVAARARLAPTATPTGSAKKPRGRPPKLDESGQRVNKPVSRAKKPRSSQFVEDSASELDDGAGQAGAPVASTSTAVVAGPASSVVGAVGAVAAVRRTAKNGWKRHTFSLVIPTARPSVAAPAVAPPFAPGLHTTRKRGRASAPLPSPPSTSQPPAKRRKSASKVNGTGNAPLAATTPSQSALQGKGKGKQPASTPADPGTATRAQIEANGEVPGKLSNTRPPAHPEQLGRVANPLFRPAVLCGGWIPGKFTFQSQSKPSSANSNQLEAATADETDAGAEAGPGPVTEANRPVRSRRQAVLASQLPPNLANASVSTVAVPAKGNQLEYLPTDQVSKRDQFKRKFAFLKDRKQPEDQSEPHRPHIMSDLAFESTIKWQPPNVRDGHLDLTRKGIRRAVVGAGPAKAVQGVFPLAVVKKPKAGQLKQDVEDLLAVASADEVEKVRRKWGIRTVPWREVGVTAGRGNARGMPVREVLEGEDGYEGAHGSGAGRDVLKEWATREPGWDVEQATTVWVDEPQEEAIIGELEAEEDRVEAEVAAEGEALREALGLQGGDGYDSGMDAEGDAEEDEGQGGKEAASTAPTSGLEAEGGAAAEVAKAPAVEAEAVPAGPAPAPAPAVAVAEAAVALETTADADADAMEVDAAPALETDALAVLGLTEQPDAAQAEKGAEPAAMVVEEDVVPVAQEVVTEV